MTRSDSFLHSVASPFHSFVTTYMTRISRRGSSQMRLRTSGYICSRLTRGNYSVSNLMSPRCCMPASNCYRHSWYWLWYGLMRTRCRLRVKWQLAVSSKRAVGGPGDAMPRVMTPAIGSTWPAAACHLCQYICSAASVTD